MSEIIGKINQKSQTLNIKSTSWKRSKQNSIWFSDRRNEKQWKNTTTAISSTWGNKATEYFIQGKASCWRRYYKCSKGIVKIIRDLVKDTSWRISRGTIEKGLLHSSNALWGLPWTNWQTYHEKKIVDNTCRQKDWIKSNYFQFFGWKNKIKWWKFQ